MDKTKWKGDELIVMEEYGFRCVLCGFQYADTLHHEPPRSLNPNHKEEPWTQFPLCRTHHDFVQDIPREEAEEILLRFEYTFAPGAINRIKERTVVTE